MLAGGQMEDVSPSTTEKIEPILILWNDSLLQDDSILWLHLNNNYLETLGN